MNQLFLKNSLNSSAINKTNCFSDKVPRNKPLRWYTCGPTVYDYSHIGHARTFITFDILRRIFNHLGYTVHYVMNITDIDDKIIKRVNDINSENQNGNNSTNTDTITPYTPQQLTKEMEQNFFDDMAVLNVQKPHYVTRVTEYIPEMISYIQKIIDNGLAYQQSGSIYLDYVAYEQAGLDTAPFYKIPETDFTTNEFVGEKKNLRDFVLWKASKPGEEEVTFNATFTFKIGGTDASLVLPGRPGWHLECSVMSSDILGQNEERANKAR